jgi:hypothetical protein
LSRKHVTRERKTRKSGKEIGYFSMIEKDKKKRRERKGASTFCIFPPATHS